MSVGGFDEDVFEIPLLHCMTSDKCTLSVESKSEIHAHDYKIWDTWTKLSIQGDRSIF